MSSPAFRSLPLSTTQLSLAAVLRCGQSFRWSVLPLSDQHSPHEYRLCLRDRVVCLRQTSDTLLYRSVYLPQPSSPKEEAVKDAETLAWIRDYFQLDVDLMELYSQWSSMDPVFEKVKDRFEGIRILRQDPFECLLSYVLFKPLARLNCISSYLASYALRTTIYPESPRWFSRYAPSTLHLYLSLPPPKDGTEGPLVPYHPFPPPSALAAPEVAAKLRSLGFGYRADFIQKTAKMLVDAHGNDTSTSMQEPAEKWLLTLRQLSTSDARTELLKFMGVGRKVADCVLLMSLDKREVVPVDTHVHQIAVKHYGLPGSSKSKATMTPKLYDDVSMKLVEKWGDYAGWAHSVLFTSDLKAFANYGLDGSSSSPSLSKIAMPSSASPSPTKRKRATTKAVEGNTVTDAVASTVEEFDELSLAERVKRRRQVCLKVSAK